MQISSLFVTLSLALHVHSAPTCSTDDNTDSAYLNTDTQTSLASNTGAGNTGTSNTGTSSSNSGVSNNSTRSPSGGGTKFQATVTGSGVCLTQGMACGITGSPGKDPTAAMSAYLIPTYGKGNHGTCWKLSNPRKLDYHGDGTDQEKPGAIGQCTKTDANPKDELGSQSVLDLCSETNAVQMFFGSPKPGLAVADIEQVDCSEWSETIRKLK
ncbi:MAG: hypothetical protein Q9217_005631 [Psora testacea]